MKTVLVGTDFSSNAFMAARFAAFLAGNRQWHLHICHVYRPFYSGFRADMQNEKDREQAAKEACEKMEDFIQRLQQLYPGIKIKGCCLVGHVKDIIPAEAEKTGAALIVMGTQGASGLKYPLIGSNTFQVIQRSAIPVLAVPAGATKFSFKRVGFTTNYHAAEITALHDFISLVDGDIEIIPFHMYVRHRQLEEVKMKAWQSKTTAMVSHRPMRFRLSRMHSYTSGFRNFIKKEKLDALAMTSMNKDLFSRLFKKDLIKTIVHQSTIPVLFLKEK
jgi:nucleotide-binding universal stress UspA family protein